MGPRPPRQLLGLIYSRILIFVLKVLISKNCLEGKHWQHCQLLLTVYSPTFIGGPAWTALFWLCFKEIRMIIGLIVFYHIILAIKEKRGCEIWPSPAICRPSIIKWNSYIYCLNFDPSLSLSPNHISDAYISLGGSFILWDIERSRKVSFDLAAIKRHYPCSFLGQDSGQTKGTNFILNNWRPGIKLWMSKACRIRLLINTSGLNSSSTLRLTRS